MIVASEADDAWWPPTFSPSSLSRRWLALWIVQIDEPQHLSLELAQDVKLADARLRESLSVMAAAS